MDEKAFPKLLLAWYDKHGRDLPWRKPSPAWLRKGASLPLRHTHDPYQILLSEIMLQQTQVPRVIVKWQEWLAKFPRAKHVADASTRNVLLAWQGMGYNNRALRLKECCERVVKNGWPQTPEELEELPGIGRYTAHAIACFAFGQRVPIVDVNVKLVYAPFIGPAADDDKAWEFAWNILPKERFYDYNQSLFDLGTVIRSGDLSSLPTEFQALYKDVELKKVKSKEKLYAGYPLRLYRGALVQCLRESKGHAARLKDCAAYIETKLAKRPLSFVKEVGRRLEKDGIVVMKSGRIALC
jgi:A/G-specific adenine glycosylase